MITARCFCQRRVSSYVILPALILAPEFFLRQIYKCTAQASSDVVLFELSFAAFWAVVEVHRLEESFSGQCQQQQRDEDQLTKDSTHQLVKKFSSNLGNKNSKMSMMMSVSSSYRGQVFQEEHTCVLPDSWIHHCWSMASIVCIVYLSLSVPFFIAFRSRQLTVTAAVAVVVCDALLCVFFSVDMYLRLRYFAVLEEGELVRNQKQFSSIYLEDQLKWDLVSTLPIGLVVLGE